MKHFTFGLQLGNFTTKQLKEMQKKKFPDAQEREKWLTAFISDKTPALYELVSNCTICFFLNFINIIFTGRDRTKASQWQVCPSDGFLFPVYRTGLEGKPIL